ncbi:MAG: hypothetical protein F6J97_14050 [Leptolyngbya sp. SIO4C1]|nr:hypothetical protein [Leptolyngbya sp. SIO4C1]
MNSPTMERQQLIEAVRNLPDEVLFELASFLDYLRYKTLQHSDTDGSSDFLSSITGLGHSGQQNIAEQDEEILRAETDPIYGWSSKPSNQV